MSARISVAIFPITLVVLAIVERLVAVLLGSNPSSAVLWEASATLRSVFSTSSGWLGMTGNISVQIGLLTLLGVGLVVAMRRPGWHRASFAANHAAFLFAAFMTVAANGGEIASLNTAFFGEAPFSLHWAPSNGFLHAVFLMGVAGCALSHRLYLKDTLARHKSRALLMRQLAFDLEDGRSARRISRTYLTRR